MAEHRKATPGTAHYAPPDQPDAAHAVYTLVLSTVIQDRAEHEESVTERAAERIAELHRAVGLAVSENPADLGFLVHRGHVRVALRHAVRRAEQVAYRKPGALEAVRVLSGVCRGKSVSELETLDAVRLMTTTR